MFTIDTLDKPLPIYSHITISLVCFFRVARTILKVWDSVNRVGPPIRTLSHAWRMAVLPYKCKKHNTFMFRYEEHIKFYDFRRLSMGEDVRIYGFRGGP